MNHHVDVYYVYAFIEDLEKLFQISNNIEFRTMSDMLLERGRFSSLYSNNIDLIY